MKNIIFLLLLVSNCMQKSNNDLKEDQLYKILKIESNEVAFKINVKKNNVLFTIFSDKKNMLKECYKIVENEYYELNLKSFRDSIGAPITTKFIDYKGLEINLEKEHTNDVFFTHNLHGLCYKK